MDPLWSETCWCTFKYFIILIVSTYYTLCISWIIKCLSLTSISAQLHVTCRRSNQNAHHRPRQHYSIKPYHEPVHDTDENCCLLNRGKVQFQRQVTTNRRDLYSHSTLSVPQYVPDNRPWESSTKNSSFQFTSFKINTESDILIRPINFLPSTTLQHSFQVVSHLNICKYCFFLIQSTRHAHLKLRQASITRTYITRHV